MLGRDYKRPMYDHTPTEPILWRVLNPAFLAPSAMHQVSCRLSANAIPRNGTIEVVMS